MIRINFLIIFLMMKIKLKIRYLKKNLLFHKNFYAKYVFKIRKRILFYLVDTFVIV